jgi:FKBP-type peptidyl-prolyl cis-trans isomerase
MRVFLATAALAVLASCAPGESQSASVAEQAEEIAATEAAAAPALATPADNLAAAEAYLAENGARAGVATTPTGLQYQVLAEGAADAPGPTPGQYVCVHYRGTLLDGTEFDSSYSRGQAAAFPSDGLIPGWVEALSMMQEGDAWRLFIHPDLAYGQRGIGPIPPNSALIFDMELIKLLDGPAPNGVDCSAS